MIKPRFPVSTTRTARTVTDRNLRTVCESAKCPNRMECWGRGTATFMILGDVCTRKCGFCAIQVGKPLSVDEEEPRRVAEAARELGLSHVVVTSVARDDLKDGGAEQFYETILAIRDDLPDSTIEVLTPDFKGNWKAIDRVCEAEPDIYNHNLETVRRLSPLVRSPNADHARSLNLLAYVKAAHPEITTKSGLMVGLGERREEMVEAFRDLHEHNCQVLTVGQYLQPLEEKLSVEQFVPPEEFEWYEREARAIGFREVFCGPFVRSSYHADEMSSKILKRAASRHADEMSSKILKRPAVTREMAAMTFIETTR